MKIALDTLWQSIVRSIVPYIVGGVISAVAFTGIALDPEFEAAFTVVIALMLGLVYQVIARLLETHVSPKFSWLLGSSQQPVAYVKPEVPGAQVHTDKVHTTPDTAQIVVHQSK